MAAWNPQDGADSAADEELIRAAIVIGEPCFWAAMELDRVRLAPHAAVLKVVRRRAEARMRALTAALEQLENFAADDYLFRPPDDDPLPSRDYKAIYASVRFALNDRYTKRLIPDAAEHTLREQIATMRDVLHVKHGIVNIVLNAITMVTTQDFSQAVGPRMGEPGRPRTESQETLCEVIDHMREAGISLRAAIRYVAGAAYLVWGLAEYGGEYIEAGHDHWPPLTDDQFRALWGPTVDRQSPAADRIEVLTERIKMSYRRGRNSSG